MSCDLLSVENSADSFYAKHVKLADIRNELKAVRYVLDKYEHIQPDFYTFLKHTGVFDQLLSCSGIGNESVYIPVMTKLMVRDQLLRGCDHALEQIDAGMENIFTSFVESVSKFTKQVVDYFDNSIDTIKKLHTDLTEAGDAKASDAPYGQKNLTLQDMQYIIRISDTLSSGLSKIADRSVLRVALTNNTSALEKLTDDASIKRLKERKYGGKSTLGEAGLDVHSLRGDAFNMVKQAYQYINDWKKTVPKLNSMSNEYKETNKSDDASSKYGKDTFQALSGIIKDIKTLQKFQYRIVRSWVLAARAALAGIKKDQKNTSEAV